MQLSGRIVGVCKEVVELTYTMSLYHSIETCRVNMQCMNHLSYHLNN